MKENPDIIIEYDAMQAEQFFAKITALQSANQLPDIINSQSADYFTITRDGMLQDITADLKGPSYEGDAVWQDTFIPELLNNYRSLLRALGNEYTSKFWGVPYGMTSIAVVYDKNMFAQMGLKAPTNWQEFTDLNDTLVQAGKVPLSLTQPWLDWYPRLFWDQFCRDVLDNNPAAFEDGTIKFTSDSVKRGLREFKIMWDKKWLPENGTTASREIMQQAFVQGAIAQFLATPAMLPYMYENMPPSVSLSSYAFPAIGNLPPRSLGGSSSVYSLSKTTKNRDKALRFLKFITSKTHWSQDYAKFSISGLTNVQDKPETAQLREGYNKAAQGGFVPEIFVPINASPELRNAWRSDFFPNYLLGRYSLDEVSDKLQKMYEETYLALLKK
jgi:ABC-type glycerol-3-phosphate transport system substrate-binding protein